MEPGTIRDFFCSNFETEDVGKFFLALLLTRNAESPSDLSYASLNICATDGHNAWTTQEDLTEQTLGSFELSNRMRHTLEALADFQPDPKLDGLTESYTCKFTLLSASTQLMVEIEWDNKHHGKDIVSRLHFTLDAAPDPAEAVRWVMGGLLGNCRTLQSETNSLEEACRQLQEGQQGLEGADKLDKKLVVFGTKKEKFDANLRLTEGALLSYKQNKLEAMPLDEELV